MIQPACGSYIASGIHKCAALKGQRKCGHLYSQIWFIRRKICQAEFKLTKAVEYSLWQFPDSFWSQSPNHPSPTHHVANFNTLEILHNWLLERRRSITRATGWVDREKFHFQIRLCHAKFIAALPNYCSCLFGASLAGSKSTKIE